jgi:hypothetical protein
MLAGVTTPRIDTGLLSTPILAATILEQFAGGG